MIITHLDSDTLVSITRNRKTNTYVELYDNRSAVSAEDAPWTTGCIDHATSHDFATRAEAEEALREPETWCSSCEEKLWAEGGATDKEFPPALADYYAEQHEWGRAKYKFISLTQRHARGDKKVTEEMVDAAADEWSAL